MKNWKQSAIKQLFPNIGTVVIVALLILAQTAGANEAIAPQSQLNNPFLLPYQGTLTDQNQDPLNATVVMEFSLYNDAVEGGRKWGPEIHTVAVQNGLFNVMLGSITPIDPNILSGALYLDITVNGETLLPRELLTSVPYAVKAETASIVWPPSYDGDGGVDTAMPGFLDTLYFATQRDITVSANRDPDTGALARMFNLSPNSYAGWSNVSSSNPVIITISYTGDGPHLDGVLLSFGWRNSQAIDYKIEYREDADDDGTYIWTPIAEVIGNTRYQVYHIRGTWRVRKIRITVTDAGDGSMDQQLRIATIQAYSSIHGSATGHMLGVNGGKLYGALNMNGNSVTNCGALTEANLQTPEELAAERIDRFEEGDVLCWTGEQLDKCETANDVLVQAVADIDGRPIVIGAEVVKVLGPVQMGDILVASDVSGYAMVNNNPRPGTVIAQALEDLEGEQGVIKAMIRKW